MIFRPMECLSSRYFRSSARGRAIWAYGILLICGHPSAPGTRPLDQIPPSNLLTAPQSNGKIERFHRTLKHDPIHALTPDGVRATIAARIDHYNNVRLHSAVGYVTPRDKLLGNESAIWAERDRKLEEARELRRQRRKLADVPAVA